MFQEARDFSAQLMKHCTIAMFGASATPQEPPYNFEDDIEYEDAPTPPTRKRTAEPLARDDAQRSDSGETAVRCRTEGATALAAEHAVYPFDNDIRFYEKDHYYSFRGKRVPVTVTTVVKDAFHSKPFDGQTVVDRYYASWKAKGGTGEYWDIISAAESDEVGKLGILKEWSGSSAHGTKVHAELEKHMNRYGVAWRDHSFIAPDSPASVHAELKQLDHWAAWEGSKNLIPWRSELSTGWLDKRGECVVAGQCDLLMFDTERKVFVMVDLKCIKGKHSLLRGERAYRGECPVSGVMAGVQASKHNTISLQIFLYIAMIEQSHGWACNEGYILRVHGKDRATFQWIKCTNFKAQAVEILNSYCL